MRGEKKTYSCKCCGEKFIGYKSQPKTYCSMECYHLDVRNGNGNGPQRQKSFPIDLSIYEESLGNIILYDCGCGDEKSILYNRHLHHFDYTSNLVLSLCPSCHKRWHIQLHKRRLAAQAASNNLPNTSDEHGDIPLSRGIQANTAPVTANMDVVRAETDRTAQAEAR